MRALVVWACGSVALCAAQQLEIEIEITGSASGVDGQDSAAAIYSRLLDAVSVDPDSGAAPIDGTTYLQGIRSDAMVMSEEDDGGFFAGVDITSESGARMVAGEGFEITSGRGADVKVQETAKVTAGGVDLSSHGSISMMGGDDAELSVAGDIGATASGTVKLSSEDVEATLAGAASIAALGEMKVEAGGAASLAAKSLLASVQGDVGVLGRGIRLSGSEELSVVASAVDVQTPGSIRLAGKGGLAEVDGEAVVEFVTYMWRSSDRFAEFENVLPDVVADVAEVLVRATVGSAAIVAGPRTSVELHLGEDNGAGGTTFGTVWSLGAGSGDYTMDGLVIKLDRPYAVSVIRLQSSGGSGETFTGWSEVEFLLGQQVASGAMRVASASNLEATAVGGVLLGADAVHVSAAKDLAVDAANTQLSSDDVGVKATGELSATAKTLALDVSETVQMFAGGDLSGSFASVQADARGPASLSAAGAIDVSGESADLILSGKLDASVDAFQINSDDALVSAQTMSATAAEQASLHTRDASLSASGTLDAFMGEGDIMSEGGITVRTGGDLSAVTQDLLLVSEAAQLHSGQMDATLGHLNLDATAMDITSDGDVRTSAGGELDVLVGETLHLGVQGSAEMVAESLEVQSLSKVGLIAGGDAELLANGDLGATLSGSASLDAAELTTRVTGATSIVTGDDISLAAGGDATMAADSLQASVKGDVAVLGSGFKVTGTDELSVVAGELDVQSAGDINLAGPGASAQLNGAGIKVATASDLEASATGQVLLNAGGDVHVSAAVELDVSAPKAQLLTNDLGVQAQQMAAKTDTLSLEVADGISAFSGGAVGGSFGSIRAESRAGASLAAAGAIDVAGESATFAVSGDLDATASDMNVRTGTVSLASASLTATASESAALQATDASLSLAGQLDAYMGSGEILADGDLAVRSAGDITAQASNVQFDTSETARVTAGGLETQVGNVKFHATQRDGSGSGRRVTMPLDCAGTPGGCDGISDADSPAMIAELAQLLGIHPSRLNVHISTDDNEAELEGGRRRLGSSRWNPPAGKTIGSWTVDELTLWLGEEMEMKVLAGAVKREGVDGEMALEMLRPDWQELGASGLKASRVVKALRLLARAQEEEEEEERRRRDP
jgi:hypothetical protein